MGIKSTLKNVVKAVSPIALVSDLWKGPKIDKATPSEQLAKEAGNTYGIMTDLTQRDAQNTDIAKMRDDPSKYAADNGLNLTGKVPQLNPNTPGTTLDPNSDRYKIGQNVEYDAAQTEASLMSGPTLKQNNQLETATSVDKMSDPKYSVNAAQGEITDDNLVKSDEYTLDTQGSATGINTDGSTNYTGKALNDYAAQNISMMIDTSTSGGKLLAQSLGEGDYIDTKATIIGQMEIISKEFKNSKGEPQIPPWAQPQHKSVMRSISFKGMSGSAALRTSSNAIMEATLPIAESEAKFFQSLTTKNLDNRQQAILNKAKTLAAFDTSNLEARSVSAIQNAKNFLTMDLANMDKSQEAEIINVAERVDALFTDVAAENVARRINVENEIQNRQFYEQLEADANKYNASAIAATREANAGRQDTANQFNVQRRMDRDKYEADMARYIDESVARWKQTVHTANTQRNYEAAAADVSTAINLNAEGMNKLWDRVDKDLDYIYTLTAGETDREFQIIQQQKQAKAARQNSILEAIGTIGGAVAGVKAGNAMATKV